MSVSARNIVLCLCIFSAFASCRKQETVADLSFDATPVVSEHNRFALILDPYVSLRDAPGDKGITVAHARRGDVQEVKGVKILTVAGKPVHWLELDGGWIPASSVSLYSNRRKAQRISETLGN
ncbi:MAG: hypothetical protein EWM51_09590 [Treponema sp.]|nr:MAG: hypothetical protein EWM51_09590 [Treponema sp.]